MNKEEIIPLLANMAKRYFRQLEYQFDGFYYNPLPKIAKIESNNSILFNEKYLTLRNDQIERALVHELQHAQDMNDLAWNEKNESHYVFGFIFHPTFENLYKRLEQYYREQTEEKGELGLKLLPLPKNFKEMAELAINYATPTEVLARLKGYQHYLNQVSEGMDVETLPYESIEAFKEEDLKFLNLDYRKELASELQEKNPEIFFKSKPRTAEVFGIEWDTEQR